MTEIKKVGDMTNTELQEMIANLSPNRLREIKEVIFEIEMNRVWEFADKMRKLFSDLRGKS